MSSAADPTAAFYAGIRASGLIPPPQLQDLWAWVGTNRPDVQGLAREVNRRGWLSTFQIKEIFKGRGRDLVIGPYVLLDLLGEGGMGRVYKARHTRMGREVALKIIRKEKLKHPAAEARFEQEIQALGKMEHPNVVKVFNADKTGDTHYYEMEFVDGTDLTKLVRDRGALPVAEACEYIRQAALGLHHAYEKGLVHRDIKPSNILVSRNGRMVKLVDLGLARILEQDQQEAGRITQEGFVIGTPDFLAPEQARNPMVVDIRADIYALGGTLFFLLTGKVPFEGTSPTEKLLKHCTEPPPRLLFHRMDAPPQVDQIIQWCLAKQPEARPQTPLQLAVALQPYSPGLSPAPIPTGYAHPTAAPGSVGIPPAAAAPRSSVVFKLPPQTTSADPIRRRSEGRFPWSYLFMGLGGLLVVAVLGYAVYLQVSQRGDEKLIDAFTTSEKTNSVKMLKLGGGKFRMGSPDNEPGRKNDEGPAREVSITGPLLISATEITNSQYVKVMSVNQSKSAALAHKAQNIPVEYVSWHDAMEFCQKLTEAEKNQPWARKGWAFRLPTEAEWEYAARGGTETPFAFGTQIVFEKQALFRIAADDPFGVLAPEKEMLRLPKDPRFPMEAGKTEANQFGLFDMHGNVAEWCLDWYRPGYPADGASENPTGPNTGDRHVIRGGSFRSSSAEVRSAARADLRESDRRDDVGFRIVYAPVAK